jgi:hypothetical protein
VRLLGGLEGGEVVKSQAQHAVCSRCGRGPVDAQARAAAGVRRGPPPAAVARAPVTGLSSLSLAPLTLDEGLAHDESVKDSGGQLE